MDRMVGTRHSWWRQLVGSGQRLLELHDAMVELFRDVDVGLIRLQLSLRLIEIVLLHVDGCCEMTTTRERKAATSE